MTTRETVIREIEQLPEYLVKEVADFVGYLKVKKAEKRISEITLASENSLSKDWNRPEEDSAWQDL